VPTISVKARDGKTEEYQYVFWHPRFSLYMAYKRNWKKCQRKERVMTCFILSCIPFDETDNWSYERGANTHPVCYSGS